MSPMANALHRFRDQKLMSDVYYMFTERTRLRQRRRALDDLVIVHIGLSSRKPVRDIERWGMGFF